MPKIIYQAVTNDEYELPIAQADSMRQLAIMLGLHENTVSASMRYRTKKPTGKHRFIKVVIDDE